MITSEHFWNLKSAKFAPVREIKILGIWDVFGDLKYFSRNKYRDLGNCKIRSRYRSSPEGQCGRGDGFEEGLK